MSLVDQDASILFDIFDSPYYFLQILLIFNLNDKPTISFIRFVLRIYFDIDSKDIRNPKKVIFFGSINTKDSIYLRGELIYIYVFIKSN